MATGLVQLKVFLAAPSDLAEERDVAGEVLTRVNNYFAEARGFFLKLIEFPMSILPGIGSEPQDVINRQISDCDIYLVLFWKRFGTPTRNFPSGTIEEFERAYGRWLTDPSTRVLVYFSRRTFYPSLSDIGEIAKVFQFKAELSERGVLYRSFESITEFEAMLSEHLGRLVMEREAMSGSASPSLIYQLGIAKNFTRDLEGLVDEMDQVAVIYIDLDQFTELNKRLSPHRGTEVLNDVACALFGLVKNKGSLYRYAGDEFTVLLAARPQHEVVLLAEKIRQAIENSGPHDGVRLTASIGVACAPSVPKGELFRHAYKAVYVSKLRGKNTVTICPLSDDDTDLVREARARENS